MWNVRRQEVQLKILELERKSCASSTTRLTEPMQTTTSGRDSLATCLKFPDPVLSTLAVALPQSSS